VKHMFGTDNKDKPERIIASYIFNMTKFISWPPRAFNFSVSPFIIGIYKNNAFGTPLSITLREKKIQDRDWKVELFNDAREIRNCHLVFFTGIHASETESVISTLKHKPILTLAYNINNFCQTGGMINIVGEIPNLGFEINKQSLEFVGLEISAELLNLATIV